MRALVVLVLAALPLTAGAAWATWSASRTVSSADVRSGTFGVTAAWTAAPDLAGMLPGSQRDGVLAVTHTGDGRWRYAVTSTFTGTLRPTLTETFYAGPVCTGTPLAPGALSAQTYARGATAQVCVRYALPVGTPGSLQGATSQITVTVRAESRPS